MAIDITIDLQNSTHAKSIEGNLIHQPEYERVLQWIEQQVERAEHTTKERLHEAITVLGTRGSGKSTFLYSTIQKYTDAHPEVASIEIIDPTLIEEKGHILLDIISRIKELVDEQLEISEVNQINDDYLLKKNWHDLVKSLAYGLPLLDGVGGSMTENSWQDPEFIMSNGIRAVNASRKLEKNFHKFIEMALTILKKKAVIIAFDDIDIDFKKGWRVIETIRKYFTSPKIITIITGDIELYSKAIRKQQWENFGKALLINEGDRQAKTKEYNDLVTEMEGQYLQKVLRSDKRVHLTTLKEKTELYGQHLAIEIKRRSGSKTGILEHYNLILHQFGINNNFYAEPFRSFLMSLPLRAQIQFLNSVDEYISTRKSNNFRSQTNIIYAFTSDLLEKKVDFNLALSSPKYLNIIILRLLRRENSLEELYQLQPTSDDASLNASLMALSLLFNQKVNQNPFLIFDYLIKIGYIRNIANSFNRPNPRSSLRLTLDGVIEHTGILQDKVLRDTVGGITAYIRANIRGSRQSWGGTILLPAFADPQNRSTNELNDRIDRVFPDQPGRTIAYIPLSIVEYPLRNDTMLVYSFYGLLATIGELTRNGLDMLKGILEYSQLRSYPMPQSDTDYDSRENEGIQTDINDFKNSGKEFDELKTVMENWLDDQRSLKIAPYLLGKISTRFHFAMNNIESGEVSDNLGEMFNNRIIAFFNALIVEDIKEKNTQDFENINLGNTNLSDRIFIDNLSAIRNSSGVKYLPLSRWLLTCPLFLFYIKPELVKTIDSVFKIQDYEVILNMSVYNQMTKVASIRKTTVTSSNISIKVSGTPAMRSLLKIISEAKPPFVWFVTGSDKKQTGEKNRLIVKEFPKLFPDNYGQASNKIRDFRKFLADNGIKSW